MSQIPRATFIGSVVEYRTASPKDAFHLAWRHADLEALALRIARLNRDAGEIGPGMLADLVDTARRLTR